MKVLTAALGIGLLLGDAAQGQETTMEATGDSWLSGLSSTTIHGEDDRLGICPAAEYWIYLKFDLSEVEGPVQAAEIRMTRFSGSRPEEIALYAVSDDGWSEATLNGPNRPAPTSPDPADALAAGQAEDNYDCWSSPELLALVQGEAAGDGTLSVMIREDPHPTLDVRNYFSREGASTPAQAPQLVLALGPSETIHPDWEIVEVGAGTKPAFDFGPDGMIHIMGMTEMFGGRVWHASATATAGTWNPRTVATGYFYGPGDLIVDGQGVAHMAWHNHDSQNPNHATVEPDSDMVVRELDDFPSHDGWDNSLALDAGGNLFQASVDPVTFGATESLEFWAFDGESWTGEKVPGAGPFMYGFNTSVALDRMGRAHIVFCQGDDWTDPGNLMYAVRNETEWSVTAVTGGGIHRFPSLQLDHWDRPHVAWVSVNPATPTRADVQYGVFNNNAWEIETVDTLTHVDLSLGGARKSASLVLDGNFRPHVAYSDERIVRYAVKPFADWEITTVAESLLDRYKGLVVMRLDGNEEPGLVFWETAAGLPGQVRYASPRGPAMTLQADLNQDGIVDELDLLLLIEQWHSQGE